MKWFKGYGGRRVASLVAWIWWLATRQCERVRWPRVSCDECAMTAAGVIIK